MAKLKTAQNTLSPDAIARVEARAAVRIRRMKAYAAQSEDREKLLFSTPAPVAGGVLAGNK